MLWRTSRRIRARRAAARLALRLALGVALAGAIGALPVAWAQEENSQEDAESDEGVNAGSPARAHPAIEEITVRARRRDERLSDVPVSVTVLDQSMLQATQAQSLEDVAALVPNLTILSGRSGQDASVVLRGIGAFPFVFFDQGVGTYVDGVFLARQQGSLLDIIDIDQIEVLRGPQGTLFGKNTVGGALSITTAKPTDELAASVTLRAGSFDLVQTRTMLNIPIPWGWFEDRLFTRFSFGSTNDKGYTKNRETGERYSDQNALNFYGSARLEPMDNVHFTVNGQWSRDHNRGLGGRCVVIQEDGFPISALLPEGFFDACRQSDDYRFRSDLPALSDNISYGVWGTLVWDGGARGFFDDVGLRYTGAWRQQQTRTKDDAEMTAFPIFSILQAGNGPLDGGPQDAKQVQQELQLSGAFEDFNLFGDDLGYGGFFEQWNLHFVAGAFGFWESAQTDQTLQFLTGNPLADSNAGNGTTDNTADTNNWDWALFGQGVLDITEWMSITAGARFTREKKALKRLVVNAVQPDPPLLVSFDKKDKFQAWTPMASIALKAPASWLDRTGFLDHFMPYFTWSKGFKGGGFNGLARTTEEGESFDPELANSYEVGLKTAMWDHRVTINGALYRIDRDNQQVPQLVAGDCPPDEPPPCLAPTQVFVRNAAEARSRGFELELLAAPLDGLQVNSSVGFSDSTFLDFPMAEQALTGEPINRAGQQQAFTPEWQTSLGVQYTYALPSFGPDWTNGSFVPRVDWYWESPVHNFAPEVEPLRQGAYHLVNLRLGYAFNDDQSEIAFWVKNLTDARYFKNALSWPRLTGTGIRYYEPPRTFGVELHHYFN